MSLVKKQVSNGIFILLLIWSVALVAAPMASEKRLQQLEIQWQQMQQDIQQLKQDVNIIQHQNQAVESVPQLQQRITDLENYAVQLYNVLSKLQKQYDKTELEVTQLAASARNQPNITLYGTFAIDKKRHEATIFDAQSVELVFSGQPHQKISYFTEFEFERAATVGGGRGGEVLVEQAYLDLQLFDWMSSRTGVILIPFGNIEENHYTPIRETISKTLTAYALAPSDWFDNGTGLTGQVKVNKDWLLFYQTYLTTGLGSDISATGLRGTRQGFGVDNNNNKAFSLDVSLKFASMLNMGWSFYQGAYSDDGKEDITGWSSDFIFEWKALKLSGEYMRMNVDRAEGTTAKMDGLYLRSSYEISQYFKPLWSGTLFPDAKLHYIMQYDWVNIENPYTLEVKDNKEQRYTLGFSYRPDHRLVLKLNYEYSKASGLRILRGNAKSWLASMGYIF